ncbi:hypothetical protein BDV38DRAFT_281857 [Aspergillus pseudotamarii]|uniref:Fe2OG dioxygenase domain-containing protein n=1 Tax=Aspergillus pseudotamarii TaxID=132259 RepID=A0A5N6SXS5_ASPPS|nr:uncharacterized protein BDV38DRAFT_281857 [Aspergillus pseudotamarii]KAE8138550.1 hypothetical protein BDV38DRAFT_281857 [Aspergillus pseudotamarii]
MSKPLRMGNTPQSQASDDGAVSNSEVSADVRSSHVSANPSQLNDIDTALEELMTTIAGERSAASFACGGTIPISKTDTNDGANATPTSPLVKVYWSLQEEINARKVILPLDHTSADSSPAALKQLVSDCSPATFGRGNEDILDPSYRQAGKMEPANFTTTFHPADFRIITLIERILLPSVSDHTENSLMGRAIFAELYKLNVYSGPSGFFRSHVDTPRSVRQVGSLVVCLPAAFKGGNLLVRHQGKEIDFDWAPTSAIAIQWAAFYSDCSHEIKTVTEGERLTLTYNLYVTEPEHAVTVIPSSLVEPWTLPLYGQLNALFHNSQFFPNGGVLGIYCAHAYAHTSEDASINLPRTLKGSDLVFYSVLDALGATVEILPVLGHRKDNYYWDTDCESEDGELIGTGLHAHRKSCFSTESHSLNDIVCDEWPHERVTGITWLTGQKHWEEALSYIAYGNQSTISTRYSAAAIFAAIPNWEERSST